MKFLFYFIFCFLFNYQFYAQDGVSVYSSGYTVWGIAGIDLGFGFELKNIETNKIYTSEVLSFFKQRHSYIENIPAGKYQVVSTEYNSKKNEEDPETVFFGILEFDQNKAYYLGNFIGRRKVGANRAVVYSIEDEVIPEKLIKTLMKRKLIEKDEQIIKTYPYNSDTLIIGSELPR